MKNVSKKGKRQVIIEDDIDKPVKKKIVVTSITHQILKQNNIKMKHIVHISDVHIRKNERDEEYREVFDTLSTQLLNLQFDPETTIIVLTGDILNDKLMLGTTVSLIKYFFVTLTDIAPVAVLIGNHEKNKNNLDEIDSLSPVIGTNFESKHSIHLLSDNCVYEYNNIQFGATTVYTTTLTKCKKREGFINIGLYHGQVSGAVDHNGIAMKHNEGSTSILRSSDFKRYYDYTLLGDIHARQYVDKQQTIWYPGSFIQQTTAESLNCGFMLLDLTKNKSCFHHVKNNYGKLKIIINEKGVPNIDKNFNYPKNLEINVLCKAKNKTEKMQELRDLFERNNFNIIKWIEDPNNIDLSMKMNINLNGTKKNMINLQNKNSICDALVQYIKNNEKINDAQEERILKKINNVLKDTEYTQKHECKSIKLEYLSFDNVLIYGKGNKINFGKFKNIVGLSAENNMGKSSLLDIIMIAIYSKCERAQKKFTLLHSDEKYFKTLIRLNVNGKTFTIERHAKLSNKVNDMEREMSEKVSLFEGDKNISDGSAPGTNKKIEEKICSYYELLTSIVVNSENTSFLSMGTDKQKSILCKITNIDIYNSLLTEFKRNYNASSRCYKGNIEKKINSFSSHGKTAADIERNVTQKLKTNNDIMISLKERKKEYDSDKNKLMVEIGNLDFKIKQIENDDIFSTKINLNKINDLTNKIKQINTELKNNKNKYEMILKESNTAKRKIDEYKNIDKKNKQFNKEKKDNILQINKQINELNRNIIHCEKIDEKKLNETKQKIENELNTINNNNNLLESEKKKINIINTSEEEYEKIIRDYRECVKNEEEYNIVINDILQVKQEYDRLNKQKEEFKSYKYDKKCKFCVKNSLTIQKESVLNSLKLNNKELSEKNKRKTVLTNKLKNSSIKEIYANMIENKENKIINLNKIENISLKIDNNIYKIQSLSEKLSNINEKYAKIEIIKNNLLHENKIKEKYKELDLWENKICKEYENYMELKEKYFNLSEELIKIKHLIDENNKKCTLLDSENNNNTIIKQKYETHIKLVEDHTTLVKKRKNINNDMDVLYEKISRVDSEMNNKNDEIVQLLIVDEQIKTLMTEKKDNEQNMEDYLVIINSLDNNGLINSLLNTRILPFLETTANDILTNIGYEEVSIKQYESKNNVNKIHITGKNKINKYMEGKNGLHVLNIVFRVAIAQLNTYIRPNFILCDEMFDSADNIGGIIKMKKLMEVIRSYYDWILVISHNSDITTMYDKRLHIDIPSTGVRLITVE